MKVTVKKEVEVRYLKASCAVSNWGDSVVNGIEDTNGDLIPCRDGQNWCPEIDLLEGRIINWEQGKVANVLYRVCDAGGYQLRDEHGYVVAEYDGYVPDIMCPGGDGYSDYVIMGIRKDGTIINFDFENDLSEFQED